MANANGRESSRGGSADWVATAVSALLFGVRLATAVSLALFAAFYLQLDNPSWAGTSATIVCQPIVGSSLRKGMFRLIGTVIGSCAIVLLTMAFPQNRAGFLLGMLVWVFACTFVSTLLRNFAAYAAVLAGYTLVIIAGTSIASPDQVFQTAVSRASEISVGIVCGTLVIALTLLGDSPRRLSDTLSQLIAETAAHLAGVLAAAGSRDYDGPDIRQDLIRRTAALDPLIDQAAGEAPELMHRRPILHGAMDGLLAALSGARIVETHLRSLPPDDARNDARAVFENLPPDWRDAGQATGIPPGTAVDASRYFSMVRSLVRHETSRVSVRLTADGAANVAAGLAATANGLALLNDPAMARDLPRPPRFFVADYLPALVNGLRAFAGVGAMILFWIVSEWSSGLQAVTFTAVTIMLLSALEERSARAALSLSIGTMLAAVLTATIKFAALPNHETFLAFSLIVATALVPLGALSAVPSLAPFLTPTLMNFVPLLAPTNEITFDTVGQYNSDLGLIVGCLFGALALVLIPPVPTAIRSRRLVDLSVRDLRRLAAGRRRWPLDRWQSLIYARLIAMPDDAEPAQRSFLVAVLTVGLQVIRLQRLARHGRVGAEISELMSHLAEGNVSGLRVALRQLDGELAAKSTSGGGTPGRLRARAALHIIAEAVDRQAAFFEGD